MNELDLIFRDLAREAGDLTQIQIWIYSIIGTLFISYFFVIIIQRTMNNGVRFALSIVFFLIGALFFNLAGRLITGYYTHFTLMTIANAIILAVAGFLAVVIFYKVNRRNQKSQKQT